MSERRRRNRRNRAKLDDGSNEGTAKILLKTKANEQTKNESSSKSDFKDPNDGAEYESDEAVPKLKRPYVLLNSVSGIPADRSHIKDHLRNHKDFLVVGVIGMQGVGKSTILNLLNGEKREPNFLHKLFVEKSGVFSMEVKEKKTCSHPRTENVELYITENRVILLDSPPVLGAHGRNPIECNITNLHSIVAFLTVCHLVIIVWDDNFNLNFMRLLMFAFQLKNKNDAKSSFGGLLPNILFVKNKARREDFQPDSLDRLHRILKSFFGDILFDKVEQHKSGETPHRSKRTHSKNPNRSSVRAFIFPQINGFNDISCRKSLEEIVDELRTLVFLTPRKGLGPPGEDFTELNWLEHFDRTIYELPSDCLLRTYKNVYENHFTQDNNGPTETSFETAINTTETLKNPEPPK